jgi:hypothetical protein
MPGFGEQIARSAVLCADCDFVASMRAVRDKASSSTCRSTEAIAETLEGFKGPGGEEIVSGILPLCRTALT